MPKVTVSPESDPVASLIGAPVAEAGGVRVRFGAIPGLAYTLQRSSDGLVWTALASLVAPADGLINYLDTSTTNPSFRYRIITP